MSEIRLPTVHLGSTALIVNPFQVVQATWNLLERSAGAALADAKAQGWGVIVKEALANGLDRPRAGGLARHCGIGDGVLGATKRAGLAVSELARSCY